MKLVSFISLMICLSILVVMPVCAVEYSYSVTGEPDYAIFIKDFYVDSGISDLRYITEINFVSSSVETWEVGAGTESIVVSCSDDSPIGIADVDWTVPAGATETYANFGAGSIKWDNFVLNTSSCGLAGYVKLGYPTGHVFLGKGNQTSALPVENYGVFYVPGKGYGLGDYTLTYQMPSGYGLSNETYTFGILPSTTNFGGDIESHVGSSNATIQRIAEYTVNYVDVYGQNQPLKEAGSSSNILDYVKIGGLWYGWNLDSSSFDNLKGSAFPAAIPSIANMGTGTFTFTCNIRKTDGVWIALTDTLQIGAGAELNATQRLTVEATDSVNNALITNTDIRLQNKGTLNWTNVTATAGVYDFYVPYYANLYIQGSAGGYQLATKNWTVLPYASYILKLPMYPNGTIAAANVSLNVVVLDGGTSGVFPNVNVRLSDGQVKFTSGAGVATFTVLAAKSYQIIASYTGYSSATRTLTTGTGGTSQDTYLTLNRIVVTTAPTLPPGVTAVVTLDTRTNAQKDLDMMNQIREYAPMLITLAMLMTMMYLVGYKP